MKFRTKIIVLTSLILLAGIVLTATIALLSLNNLSTLALKEVEKGLVAANEEYFVNYSKANADQVNLKLQQALGELRLVAGYTQTLEDNSAGLTNSNLTPFQGTTPVFSLSPGEEWSQTSTPNSTSISVAPGLIGSDGKLQPGAQQAISRTALLDLFLPILSKYGLEIGPVFYAGPADSPYVRTTPWPANWQTVYSTSYNPQLIQNWEHQALQPNFKSDSPNLITTLPPNLSADQNLYMRFLQPVWKKNRQKVQGVVGLDLNLNQISQPISQLQIAQNGFAFLVQSDGRIILKDATEKQLLGFQPQTTGADPAADRPFINESAVPDIAALPLPADDHIIFKEINIGSVRYYAVLTRLNPLNFLSDRSGEVKPEAWTLGFIVPRLELLGAWFATEKTINEGSQNIVVFTLVTSLLALLVVIGVTYAVSSRLTRSLSALTNGTAAIQQKNYDVRLPVNSRDEFGQLGGAFNAMAEEIARYTSNLEQLVAQRTLDLQRANQEIILLNEQLKSENLRLKTELEITRRLQQMILPRKAELQAIDELDIAAFMEPAEEVGGDYYDVLCQDGRVKIGIGDVTGHGLESGVLMIMVQTAIRTLMANNIIEPSRYMSIVNHALYDNLQRMDSDKNLTLSLIDYQGGRLSLSGQHEEVILIRADGQLELIDTLNLGFPIGLVEDIDDFVAQAELNLNPGDMVVLYTDGMTEAENPAGVQYGQPRLYELAQANHHRPAAYILELIIQDLKNFISTQKVFDDITLLVIKRKAESQVLP